MSSSEQLKGLSGTWGCHQTEVGGMKDGRSGGMVPPKKVHDF